MAITKTLSGPRAGLIMLSTVLGCGSAFAGGNTTFTPQTQGIPYLNLYLSVRGGSTQAGTDLIQWSNTNGNEQRWSPFLFWGDTPTYQEQIVGRPELTSTRLRNVNSGQCITTDGQAGHALVQKPCDPNNPYQLWTWYFRDDHAGEGFLNPVSGLWMDVEGASLYSGARIIGWYDNAKGNQLWSPWNWGRSDLISREDYTVNDTDPYIHYTTLPVIKQLFSGDANTRNLGYQALQSNSGSWGYSGGRPAGFKELRNDVHYTMSDNDAVYYSFNGTGVAYISELSADEGTIDVYIDGVFKTNVSAYRSDMQNVGGRIVYSVTGLAAGSHSIALVKKGGSYMLVDGFEGRFQVRSATAGH